MTTDAVRIDNNSIFRPGRRCVQPLSGTGPFASSRRNRTGSFSIQRGNYFSARCTVRGLYKSPRRFGFKGRGWAWKVAEEFLERKTFA